MVHLRNCQARLHSKRDARCNLEVARNEAFCPAHNAEYQALAVRGRAAAGDVQDLNSSIDALLARDVATYTTGEAVQRDIGDLERYLQVLDDRVETRMMLSRRFFTEPEHRATEALSELGRRRTDVADLLQRIRERGVVIEEERKKAEDKYRAAISMQDGRENELRMEETQLEERRSEKMVQGDRNQQVDAEQEHREETREEGSTAQREDEVPSGAVEAICDEEPESVPEPDRQPTHNEDMADRGQGNESEGHPPQGSASSREETAEEAERRREQVKHQIKVLNEYRRKKAAEESKKEEERTTSLRVETAPAGGSDGSGSRGLETVGRVALVCTVVGIALFLGVRNKDTIMRLTDKCMGK